MITGIRCIVIQLRLFRSQLSGYFSYSDTISNSQITDFYYSPQLLGQQSPLFQEVAWYTSKLKVISSTLYMYLHYLYQACQPGAGGLHISRLKRF